MFQVREFARDVFMDWRFSSELRMMAVKQLLETRPPYDLVNMVAWSLLYTQDEKLGIFTYSYLKSFSKSKTPDNILL